MLRKIKEKKYIFFLLSIILTSLCFSTIKTGYVIFFAIVPFFYLLDKNLNSYKTRFILGFLWGFFVNLSVLWWITHVSFAGCIALCLYHTLYIIIFSLFFRHLKNSFTRSLFWVLLELVRSNFLSGSPYGVIGVSVSDWPIFMQMASLGGVLLISFWIVLINFLIADFIREKNRINFISLLLIFSIPVVFSYLKLNFYPSSLKHKEKIKTAIVQPNITPDLKWDFNKETEQYKKLLDLALTLKNKNIDLIVLPETIITNDFRLNKPASLMLSKISSELNTKILFGSSDELKTRSESYNSVFLADDSLNVIQSYSKIKLVPFGEYIPFEKKFPKMKYLTPIKSGFLHGSKFSVFPLKSNISFAVLICFEDTLSSFTRKMASSNIDFLITLTNDGWFPGLYGPLTHDRLARFRAVENGMPLLRCSNTGISSWINKNGKTIKSIKLNNKTTDIKGTMICDINISKKNKTIFSIIGYSWILVLFALNFIYYFLSRTFKIFFLPS